MAQGPVDRAELDGADAPPASDGEAMVAALGEHEAEFSAYLEALASAGVAGPANGPDHLGAPATAGAFDLRTVELPEALPTGLPETVASLQVAGIEPAAGPEPPLPGWPGAAGGP
ncbi:MAG: hypothetical protein ACR2KK_12165 [Acidimicrobiales bacterium]